MTIDPRAHEEPVVHAVVRSFRRGGRAILTDVTLTIRPREHWAVVGPNGSGKTSLLRILAGYEWPSDGEMHVLGREFGAVDLRALRTRIGVVSSALDAKIAAAWPGDATALDVVLSGLDASFGTWRVFDDAERARSLGALASVGAAHLADRSHAVLSQGERQRVLIARAIVSRPALLILDEACSGLDVVARESFLADLAALAGQPDAPTIVLVTHHPEEIAPFVSHALLLSEGRVVASGPIATVLTSAPFSRAFGAPCVIAREDDRFVLRLAR